MTLRWTLALLLAACAPAALAEPPTPLLWKVSDADNSIYLLGSFHLLKPGDYPLAPQVDAAFEDAERLAFELAPSEMGSPALQQAMALAARRSDGRTLQAALPAETWAALEAYAATGALPLQAPQMQGLDAWFVSLLISITEMQRQGMDPKLGLDAHFVARAAAAGKPGEGLETGAQQIALFEEMAPEAQVQGLRDTLESAPRLEAEIARLHALWRAGDAAGLYALSAGEMKAKYPDFYRRINSDRNLAWLPRLRAMLDGPGGDDTLVVVGALHLLGEEGMIALLREAGYTVERL